MRWEPANNAIGFGCYPGKSKCVQIAEDWELRAGSVYIGEQSLKELINTLVQSQTVIIASETQPENPVAGTIWLDIS